MQELPQSIKAFLYDRAVSPLFGAYIWSLFAVNFRVIMVIFSGKVVEAKFRLIENLLTTTVWGYAVDWAPWLTKFTNLIALPLSIAFAFLFLYPIVALPVFKKTLKIQTEFRNEKKKAKGGELLDQDDASEILRENAKIKREADDIVGQYRGENKSLLDKVEELREKLSQFEGASEPDIETQEQTEAAMDEHSESAGLNEMPDLDTDDYEQAEKLILSRFVDTVPAKETRDSIIRYTGLKQSIVANILEDLSTRELLITTRHRAPSQRAYAISEKGLKFAKDAYNLTSADKQTNQGTGGISQKATGTTNPPIKGAVFTEEELNTIRKILSNPKAAAALRFANEPPIEPQKRIVLSAVAAAGKLSVYQLAKDLGFSRTSAQQMLDELTLSGFLDPVTFRESGKTRGSGTNFYIVTERGRNELLSYIQ